MANFKELLRKNLDDVKKPLPLPAGSYRGIILGNQIGESAQKKTPYVQFDVAPTEALDGIDQDDLAAALQGNPLNTKKLRSTFYLSENSLYRIKDFLTSLGLEVSGRTLDEVLADTKGMNVLLEVVQKPSSDGTDFYNEIQTIAGEQ